MNGNSFGRLFRFTTFGESHGEAMGCTVSGVPAGVELEESDIQTDLDRRKPGQSMRSEEHTSELQSHAPISYAVFCLKKKK